MRRVFLTLAVAAVLLVGGFALSAYLNAEDAADVPVVIDRTDDPLQPYMEGIYAADRDLDPPRDSRIRAVIVPHHLAASGTIASGLGMLAHQSFSRVILLSPDHFDRCPTLLCMADTDYRTPLGDVRAASGTLDALRGSPYVTEDAALFAEEHGISAVVPFIAHYAPGVRVTPLVLSQRMPWKGEKEALLAAVGRALDDDTLLVVSSDFSHYLPLAEADEMDERTAEALFAKDIDGIASLETPGQSDCVGCLWLLASLADRGGFYAPSVVAHSNSARIVGDEDIPETTSHFAIVWYAEAALDAADIAIAGDVTMTRGVPSGPSGDVAAWWAGPGPRVVNLEGPVAEECVPAADPYRFCNARDEWASMKGVATHWGMVNNHMFDLGAAGFAETLHNVSSEDEVPVTETPVEAGGWRVLAVTESMNPVDDTDLPRPDVLALLKESDSAVPVAVLVHGGVEYRVLPTAEDTRRWQQYVDAGADAVLVAHGHMPGDVFIYKERPIFRGLGNFLFDQTDSVATSTGRMVRLRHDDGIVRFESFFVRRR